MTRAIKIVVLVIIVMLVARWYWSDRNQSQPEEESLSASDLSPLSDRIWIDHMPKTERDQVDLFVILEEPTIGAFSKSSAYAGDWASFEWEYEKGLRIEMLQSQTKHKIKAKVMKGEACAPFDYCLRLKGAPRGSKRYGSMEDWVIGSNELPDSRSIVREVLQSE